MDPKIKVLVVDDFATMRKVVRNMLRQMGIDNVSEAENGDEGFRMAKAGEFGLIVSDWNMPIMSGIEFLRELRKTEGGDAPVVVFCTTENDMEHIREAMEAGANEYIMKPFDSDILEAKFTQVGLI